MHGGVYLIVFRLPMGHAIVVRRLGRFTFAAGRYIYVGSAQRNMEARIARHARRRKPRRWHIDYLTTKGVFEGSLMFIGADKSLECRLAEMLESAYPRCVPGFGASDCRCGGHLFYVEARR